MRFLSFGRRAKFSSKPVSRRIDELEIVTSRLIRLGFAGDYHAAFHGQGIEFAQVREYQPGDDIRTIDWNVTARSGIPHVKQFIEERDLTILVAVDVSGSMHFGSLDKTKLDLASELTAVLAFSAVQNSDRVGLLLFDDKVRTYVPPRRGRMHVQTLVRSALLAGNSGGGETNFPEAVRFVERVATKRSVVIVISDFLAPEIERPLRRISQRHDVIALSIRDPREQRFPKTGLIWLTDSETGQRRMITAGEADIGRRSVAVERSLVQLMRRSGVDLVRISTSAPYDRTLLKFFQERVMRRR
ncbi:MAG: DUF58 domain-containing protein [Acidobacteriota bacterium]